MATETESTVILLREALFDCPKLLLAELIGSLAAGTERAGSDVDLLLVVDCADDNEIFFWRRENLRSLYALEEELEREIHVTCLGHDFFVAEAARASGFLTDVYLRPRRSLVGSLNKILPPAVADHLALKALDFLERLESEGQLSALHRAALACLREQEGQCLAS